MGARVSSYNCLVPYVLVLAEKPHQARSIAAALLKAAKSQGNFIEGTLPDGRMGRVASFNGHCVGHLEPQEYDPKWGKPWRLAPLPVRPPNGEWRFKPTLSDVLARIGSLWRDAEELVNACDAGREGEFIFWAALRHLGWHPKDKPATRLWIHDPSPNGIVAAWQSRKSASEKKYLRLLEAAHARWKADYIFGINMSRYVTLTLPVYGSLGHPTFSVGRVKSPTLALVQQRIDDVERFVSEKFFVLKCEFYSEKGNYFATVLAPQNMRFHFDDTRFRRYDDMKSILSEVAKNPNEWSVFDNREAKEEKPPAPFDSLEMMRTACRNLGWSPRRTMRLAQELYDKDGVITYPRTESQLIPPGMRIECERVFALLWALLAKDLYPKLEAVGQMPVSDAYFQDDKDDFLGHHAVLPTGIIPAKCDEHGRTRDAWVLWDLIVRRFLTALSPPAEIMASSRMLELAIPETELTVRALVKAAPIIIPNWLLVEDAVGNSGGFGEPYAKRQLIVFPVSAGSARFVHPHPHEGNTTATPYYTEDELLLAMRDLKLGTAATRAEIIDELYADKYLERMDNGHLFTTGLGAFHLEMIKLAGAGEAVDPHLTAAWEDYFSKVEQGDKKIASPAEFIDGVIREVEQLGRALQKLPRDMEYVLCPDTFRVVREETDEKGPVFRFFGKFAKIRFPKSFYGRTMTAAHWREVIFAGRSGYGPFRFISQRTMVPYLAKVSLQIKKKALMLVFRKDNFAGEKVVE